MNGKERMTTALSLGVPDRVPHWALAYNESSIIDIARLFTDDVPEVGYVQKMDFENKMWSKAIRSKDFGESLKALKEKRDPIFIGK